MTASIPLHIFFRQKALQNSKKFWRELAERTTKNFKFEPIKKPRKNKENADTKRTVCGGISSRSRYDPFDTAPYIFSSEGSSKFKKVLERTGGEN